MIVEDAAEIRCLTWWIVPDRDCMGDSVHTPVRFLLKLVALEDFSGGHVIHRIATSSCLRNLLRFIKHLRQVAESLALQVIGLC